MMLDGRGCLFPLVFLLLSCVDDESSDDATTLPRDSRPDVVALDIKITPDSNIQDIFSQDTGGCSMDDMYMQCQNTICPKGQLNCPCPWTGLCKKMCTLQRCCQCKNGKWEVVMVFCKCGDGGVSDV